MFGAKPSESSSLNGFSYRMFEKLFGPSDTVKNSLHKGVDASCLHHIHRSAFVAKRWAGADQQTIHQHPAPENGWDLINNQCEIIWFDGLQLPDKLALDR